MQLSILKNRNLYSLAGYLTANTLAYRLLQYTLPWVVYDLTLSGVQAALTFGAGIAPYLLFSFLGSAFIDCFNRKKILLYISAFSCLSLVAFSTLILHFEFSSTLGYVYVTSFLISCLHSLESPAFDGTVVDFFQESDFTAINIVRESILVLFAFAGPILAQILVEWIGGTQSILFTSALYLCSFIMISFSKQIKDTSLNKEFSSIGEIVYEQSQLIKEGITYMFRSNNPLLIVLFMSVMANLLIGTRDTVLVNISRHSASINTELFSLSGVCISIIALVIFFLSVHFFRKFDTFSLLIKILFFYALTICVMSFTKSKMLLLALYGIVCVLEISYNIMSRTFRQVISPHSLIGRISGIFRSLAYSTLNIGAFSISFLFKFFTAESILIISGIWIAIVAIIALILKMNFCKPVSEV